MYTNARPLTGAVSKIKQRSCFIKPAASLSVQVPASAAEVAGRIRAGCRDCLDSELSPAIPTRGGSAGGMLEPMAGCLFVPAFAGLHFCGAKSEQALTSRHLRVKRAPWRIVFRRVYSRLDLDMTELVEDANDKVPA